MYDKSYNSERNSAYWEVQKQQALDFTRWLYIYPKYVN
jgi:hypothetical protein